MCVCVCVAEEEECHAVLTQSGVGIKARLQDHQQPEVGSGYSQSILRGL